MGKLKLTVAKTPDIVDAIKAVRKMGGKKARFILIALLANDTISPEVFEGAVRMADAPPPIEATRPRPKLAKRAATG